MTDTDAQFDQQTVRLSTILFFLHLKKSCPHSYDQRKEKEVVFYGIITIFWHVEYNKKNRDCVCWVQFINVKL